jgi:hypothetical protein
VPRAAAGMVGGPLTEGLGDVLLVAVGDGVADEVAGASGLGEPAWSEQPERAPHSTSATTGVTARLRDIDAPLATTPVPT